MPPTVLSIFCRLRFGVCFWVAVFLLFAFRLCADIAPGENVDPLTPEERAWVIKHGPLRYAPDPDYPPFEWVDESGEIRGINVEVLELIAKRLKLTFVPVKLRNWTEVINKAKERQVDVVGSLVSTPERTTFLTFTQPYIASPLVVFVRASMVDSSLDELSGKRVGVVNDYAFHEFLKQQNRGFVIIPVASTREGMAMLALGKLDAMVDSLWVGSFVVVREGFDGVHVLNEGLKHAPEQFMMASSDPILARILDKGLDSIRRSELDAILGKWEGPLKEKIKAPLLPSWVGRVFGGAVILLVLVAAWAIALRLRLSKKEQQLRQQFIKKAELEARFADLARNASDLVITWSALGVITSVNSAGERILGFGHEALLRMNIFDFVTPASADVFRSKLRDLGFEAEGLTDEIQLRRQDGQVMWFEIKARRISSDGSVQAIGRDVTLRRQIKDALDREKAFLKGVVDAVPGLIWMTDSTGRIQWINTRLESLAGPLDCDSAERFGSRVFPKEQSDRIRKTTMQAVEQRLPARCEEIFLAEDGRSLVFELILNPMFGPDRSVTGVLGIGLEVTAQRKMQEVLWQNQKLESIGQLAGGVAHDFNNILAAIILQLDWMRGYEDVSPSVREQLGEMLESANRAANLTRQLLLFSRRQVAQIKPVDLDSLIGELLKMLRRLVGETIHIELAGAPKSTWVLADENMLEQVVLNLVVNARDAMPSGGRITLSTEILDFGPEAVSSNPDGRPGHFVCLTVSDTGCGIDAATMKRLFEPFFTTKASGAGTGLGLATVYGIVKKHEGWIEVSTEVGEGSTFRVYLPRASVSQVEEDFVAGIAKKQGKGEVVLLAEDDVNLRGKVAAVLAQAGYCVIAAENGRDALKKWAVHKAEVRLLLTDMVMPEDVSGLDLARTIQAEHPEIKAIIMSGYSLELSKQEVFRDERLKYLAKPFKVSALLELVVSCLG